MKRMWYFQLICTKLTDNIINSIAFNVKHLTTLYLHDINGTIAILSLKKIFLNLTNIKYLRIQCRGTINDYPDYLPEINISILSNLRYVYLQGLHKCEAVSFKHLCDLSSLEYVMYEDCEQVKCLFRNLLFHNLQNFILQGTISARDICNQLVNWRLIQYFEFNGFLYRGAPADRKKLDTLIDIDMQYNRAVLM